MNGAFKQKAQSRRWPLLGASACRNGIRSVHVIDGAAAPSASGHCYAAHGRGSQQRPAAGVLALPIRGSGVDQQGPDKARPGCAPAAWADFLHPARAATQQNQLVCRDMGAVAPPPGHGCGSAIIAAGRLQAVEEKRVVLYGNRTYETPYKYGNRTRRAVSKYGNRTYAVSFLPFLSTDSVHLLDMPSVGQKKGHSTHQRERAATTSAAEQEVQP